MPYHDKVCHLCHLFLKIGDFFVMFAVVGLIDVRTCHPERSASGVEPGGRLHAVWAGSLMGNGRMLVDPASAESLALLPCRARQKFDSACAPLRMTHGGVRRLYDISHVR